MTFFVFLVAAGLVFVFIQQSGITRANAEIATRLRRMECDLDLAAIANTETFLKVGQLHDWSLKHNKRIEALEGQLSIMVMNGPITNGA